MNEWIINGDNIMTSMIFLIYSFFNFVIYFKIIHKKIYPCFDYKPWYEGTNLLKYFYILATSPTAHCNIILFFKI